MIGKRIIWGFFCSLFLWVQLGTTTYAAENNTELSLFATSAVLMDADSGRVLYSKNADSPMAMASTTKIMTCIVVLENVEDLSEMLTISPYASTMPKVKLYLNAGEQYQVRELLYSMMLESHNDSAVALAEYVGKQYLDEDLKNKDTSQFTAEESKKAVKAFANLMNEKARELGCADTYFITPNGLDATETITPESGDVIIKEHHTTATELAKIMSYCIKESAKRDLFLEITRTPSYSFTENSRSFCCNNHNAFLSMMEGALSGKTGFTSKAGYCYVGAVERDGRTFVVALLACGWPNNKTYKWSDTKELMQYGLNNYFYKSFLEKGIAIDETQLAAIQVVDGQSEKLGEEVYAGVAVVKEEETLEGMLLRADENVQVQYQQESMLEAPVRSGEIVGTVYYSVDGTVYRTESIVATDTIEKIDFKWCVQQIWGRFLM